MLSRFSISCSFDKDNGANDENFEARGTTSLFEHEREAQDDYLEPINARLKELPEVQLLKVLLATLLDEEFCEGWSDSLLALRQPDSALDEEFLKNAALSSRPFMLLNGLLDKEFKDCIGS